MSNSTWNSEPIHLSAEVSIDVSASTEGVTLGETANGVQAADLRFSPDQAEAIAVLLTQGASKCRAMRAKG
jgi:hypothetical protein